MPRFAPTSNKSTVQCRKTNHIPAQNHESTLMYRGSWAFYILVSVAVLVLCVGGAPSTEYDRLKETLRLRQHAILKAQMARQRHVPTGAVVAPPTSVAKNVSDVLPRYPVIAPKVHGATSNRTKGAAAFLFYNLTVALGAAKKYHPIPKLHLIRIPKASSSSLSAVARRAVGCDPPGPCCRYPGVPAGSCPMRELFNCQEQKKVIGCTDHFPYLWYLFNKEVPTISMMRNPFSRAISGFFYPGIHHNTECTGNAATCFVEYTRDAKWRNVAVKMLTGDYGYSPRPTCVTNTTCRHSLQLAVENLEYFTFMGVAEMWELSMAVLHQKIPTLAPDLSVFRMAIEENEVTKGNRANMKQGYKDFRSTAFQRFQNELHEQNAQDAALFRAVVSRLCDDAHRYGLWEHEFVRKYWREHAPFSPEKCTVT